MQNSVWRLPNAYAMPLLMSSTLKTEMSPRLLPAAQSPWPVVDPHFHLWDLSAHEYPWLTERPQRMTMTGSFDPIARDYLVPDFLADSAREGVTKAVHVDAGWRYDDPVGETRWLEEVHAGTGWPHAIVARAELDTSFGTWQLNAPNFLLDFSI